MADRTFSDPDNPPPSNVTQLTDHTGDLLIRLVDNTWRWARIDGVDQLLTISELRDGFDWSDLVLELPPDAVFREVTS